MTAKILAILLVLLGVSTEVAGQTSAASICANPADFLPNALVDNNPNEPCTNFGDAMALFTSPAVCGQTFPHGIGGGTYRGALWFWAAHCCTTAVPNPMCGPLQTVCNSTALLNPPVAPFDDGNSTCAMISAVLVEPIISGRTTCDGIVPGGASQTRRQFIPLVASLGCCDGGVLNQSWICGPPPTPGHMCANESDFLPDNPTFAGDATCATMQQSLLHANLYGNASLCDAPFPGTGENFTIGAGLASIAAGCCRGARMSDTCSDRRVLPCANHSHFNATANMSLGGPSDGFSCGFVPLSLYGLNLSTCDQTVPGGSTSLRPFHEAAGQQCCNGGPPDLTCGTAAPTAAPPPRFGPQLPCGGTVRIYLAGSPAADQCTGPPVETITVPSLCAEVDTDDDLGSEFIFLINGNGACASFATFDDCMNAAGNLTAIIGGTPVTAFASSGNCFLDSSPCAFYSQLGVRVSTTPDCTVSPTSSAPTSAAPTSTPTTSAPTSAAPTSAAPTASPSTLEPTAASTSDPTQAAGSSTTSPTAAPPPLSTCSVPPVNGAPNYNCALSWACHAGIPEGDDVCRGDLSATEVHPNNTLTVVPFVRPATTTFDCFYVYPTVHLLSLRFNKLDLSDVSAEESVTKLQAGRFSGVCRVFAPFYRQATLRNFQSGGVTARMIQSFNLAFTDVLAAFDNYMANYNRGRPFVLLGHSQGAQMILQLLQTRFAAGSTILPQLIVALPVGRAIATSSTLPPTAAGEWPYDMIPPIPLCNGVSDTQCVIGYRSYAGGHSMATHFTVGGNGKTIRCVNPVAPGSGTRTLSGSFFGASPPRSFVTPPSGFAGNTPFLLYRDMYTAQCITLGDNGGLEIRVAARSGDSRVNPVDFNAGPLTQNTATHGLDVAFALDDLINTAATRAGVNDGTAETSESSSDDATVTTAVVSAVVVAVVLAAVVGVVLVRRNRRRTADGNSNGRAPMHTPSPVIFNQVSMQP